MNKLDVAIRLLQLLNERKNVNSKIVAEELNVSLRTAQRYLLELSVLPCVVNLNNNHTYSLDPTYKLSEALLSGNGKNHLELQEFDKSVGNINQMTCLMCGQKRNVTSTMLGLRSGNVFLSNNAIDKLVSIIRKKLGQKKCGLP